MCLPHLLKHTIKVLHRWDASHTSQTETTSAFLSAIFISGVTATPGDLNIIAIGKVNPYNIDIAADILFICALKSKLPLNVGFLSLVAVGCPFFSRHIGNTSGGRYLEIFLEHF